ncbi:Protein kinase-like domain protein [Metarhizium rileyi]|uniref:Protein kinase-like domain protein n=1 Tax=Metarhizium rileyi (strain RCEF 4871) TaxID=1649241 RepID=A0A162LVC9_METRR|nr:Protein kinase-like domain protein [Metarhizium rileyi RCEF 4871]
MDDDITLKYPYPPEIAERLENCLSFGNTGIVEIVPPGNQVRKAPHPQTRGHDRQWQIHQLRREIRAYERLPQRHDRLVPLLGCSAGTDEVFITLEYMKAGTLSEYLSSTGLISCRQRMTWCYEAAEAVALLHSHGIIHADIKPANMVLDDNLGLRIIDFSGCAIDNSKPLCFESARYFLPRDINVHPCSVQTDLFALGSSLFEIITGSPPYSHLDENDIEEKYREGDFPSIKGLVYGSIIEACWKQEFKSAEEVKRAIRDDHIPPTVPWQALFHPLVATSTTS